MVATSVARSPATERHERRGRLARAGSTALGAALAFTALAGGVSDALAQSRSRADAAPRGVAIEATVSPVRWLGFMPTRTIRFDLAIFVDRTVKTFSSVSYECLFLDGAGAEMGIAARGVAGRDAFAPAQDGRLVTRAHEELPDNGQTALRCRALKLEK